MTQFSPGSLAAVLLVVLAGIGAGTVPVGAAQPDVQIASATVTPEQPAPGENARIDVTIANLESSDDTIEVTDVYVRKAGEAQDRARVTDVGSVSPDGEITVPISTSFEDAGYKQLTVNTVVEDGDGDVHTYTRPLYVTVDEPDDALVSFATDEIVAGERERVNVTVANGDDEEITGVQFELNSSGTVADAERVTGSLTSGATRTYQYDLSFPEPTSGTLTGTITYTTDEGVTRTATESVSVDVVEPTVRSGFSADSGPPGNESTRVELTNLGNTAFTDVVIAAADGGTVLTRTKLRDIPDGASGSATFDVGSTANGTVTYTATYTAGGETYTETLHSTSRIAGKIRVSAVESSAIGSSVTLDGEAANVGSTDAESVVVRIPDTENVTPSPSAGEYFVGSIEASEFGTFDLRASVEPSVDSVPVELSYIVDNERVTTTQRIEVSTAPVGNTSAMTGPGATGVGTVSGGPGGSSDHPPSGGSGLPLGPIGIGLVVSVVGVGGFGVYKWRKGP